MAAITAGTGSPDGPRVNPIAGSTALPTAAVLPGPVLDAWRGWCWADPPAGFVPRYYPVRELWEIFFGR